MLPLILPWLAGLGNTIGSAAAAAPGVIGSGIGATAGTIGSGIGAANAAAGTPLGQAGLSTLLSSGGQMLQGQPQPQRPDLASTLFPEKTGMDRIRELLMRRQQPNQMGMNQQGGYYGLR